MRLIRLDSDGELTLTKDLLDGVPPYAILSHTWGNDEDEVTFKDFEQGRAKGKSGYAKIQFCGKQAQKDRLEYFWVDTCCIDKTNSVELQEAITSMFHWYRDAVKCYVYLSDVSISQHGEFADTQQAWGPNFRSSRWFTRGWTLQELLAPKVVEFYCQEDEFLGDRKTLEHPIHEITGIPKSALRGSQLSDFSVNERMLWATNRSTRKIEDRAYCLLGIFEIFMPLIYGEGDNALIRLQEQIDMRCRHEQVGSTAPSDHVHWLVTRPTNTLFQGLNNRLEGLEDKFEGIHRNLHTLLSRPKVSLERLMAWLNPVFTDEEFDAAQSSRTSGTCDWILQRAPFLDWVTSVPANVTKILWIHGPAGFGKTFLCAKIVQYLKTQHPGQVAYFFCVSDDESKRQPLAIVRTWVAQMVRQNQAAFDAAQDTYYGKEGRSATTSDIWQLFGRICKLVPNCFFVVDGFDECEKFHESLRGSTANDGVAFLQRLVEFSEDASSHILFVSREDADVRSQLLRASERSSNTFSEYEVSTADTEDDVKTFSSSIIDKKLYKKSSAVREEIAEQVSQRCSGMFLWVRLVGDRLSLGKNAKQLREMVNETPVGIEKTYERDLMRIVNLGDERDRAIRILRWTLFALRPLTVRELIEALVVDPDDEDGAFPKDDLPDTWEQEEVNDEIRRLCGSLIELRGREDQRSPRDESVHFVHFSVREYLLRTTTINFPSLGSVCLSDRTAENDLLSRICLRYICYPDLHDGSNLNEEAMQEKLDEYGFLQYAAQFWFVHAREIKDWSDGLVQLVRTLFERGGLRWVLWSYVLELETSAFDLDVDTSSFRPKDIPPLYFASWLGFMQLLQDLRRQELDHDGTGEIFSGALNAAARNGHVDTVTFLVEQGAKVNSKVVNGATALYSAARNGHLDIVSYLIEHSAELNVATSDGSTALHCAAADGLFDIVSILVKNGADVRAEQLDGETSLLLAAENGHGDIVSLLIESGAEVDACTKDGATPLMHASDANHLDIARTLVSHGADINKRNKNGQSALHLAAHDGFLSIVEFLVESGARVYQANANYCIDVIKALVNHGACIDPEVTTGLTPLHFAATHGYLDVVTFLLGQGETMKEKGPNDTTSSHVGPDVSTLYDWTPLYGAVMGGHLDVVALLIRRGAQVNGRNDWPTPLHFAVSQGRLEVVQFLLQQGAEVNGSNTDSKTPLQTAIVHRHSETAKFLVQQGADINTRDYDDATPLHNAIYCKQPQIAELLIRQGAEVNTRDDNDVTPLHSAVASGYQNIALMLIQHGADSNALTGQAKTPLYVAIENDHLDMVKLLLKHGAEVNAANKYKGTALHYAVTNVLLDSIAMLLENGADVFVLDGYGRSALDWAHHISASSQSFEKYWESYVPTSEASRLEKLHQSVCSLSQRLLDHNLAHISPGLYDLGRCLMFLGKFEDACFCLQQRIAEDDEEEWPVHLACCDLCDAYRFAGSLYVCKTCPDVDLCAACISKYPNKDMLPRCQNHEFLEVPQAILHEDDLEDIEFIGEKAQEWLRNLIACYSEPETHVADRTVLETR